jgi:hypothetical protein
MNGELLRRRFMALTAAVAGGTMLRSLGATAAEQKCYVLEKDAADEWDYVCGDSGKWCDLRKNADKITVELGPESALQQPARGRNSFALYFKDERPVTAPGVLPPNLGITFVEVSYKGRVTNWSEAIPGWKDFRFSLVADGKEIGTSTTQYASQASLPVDATVAGLRGTSHARAAIFDAASGQLVIAMTFSSKGFGDIYDAARARFAAHRAWLVAGNICIPNPPAQPCFFTTAACGAVGLPDDCFELTMMRRLRDEHLARTTEGRAEVANYYDIAPRVLAAMARRPDARRLLLRLYAGVILPGAVLVRAGCLAAAHRLYRRAVRRYAERFLLVAVQRPSE